MKLPAFLIATVALTACSNTITEQPAETTLSAIQSLEAEKAKDASKKATIVAAKSEKEKSLKTRTASADAACNRGTMTDERSFIICEDGALRKAGVVAALSAPHDPDLTIEEVAERYEIAPQVFTGIESTTYGNLVNSERRSKRRAGKHKAQTGLVQIQGKVYEVYQLSAVGKTGTIFVERKEKKPE